MFLQYLIWVFIRYTTKEMRVSMMKELRYDWIDITSFAGTASLIAMLIYNVL